MKKNLLICMIIFIMLTASTACMAVTYKDTIDTKYEGVVETLSYLGIVNGTSSTTFEPNKTVTRAEIAKMLVLAHGYDEVLDMIDTEKVFSDVKKGSWYYDYVYLANAYGLIKGYPDNKFYPDKEVTYSEAVAMILRSLGHGYILEDSEFGWDYNYILIMRKYELNKNIEAFSNDDFAKRGDIAIFIWNMLNSTKWDVVKEDGKGELTYSNSGKVLFNEVFGDKYKLVSTKKVKAFDAMYGNMYANVETLGEVELNKILPIYALGTSIDGIYDIKKHLLIWAAYDIGSGVEEGLVEDLADDGYKLKYVKTKYSIGGSKNDYAFFIVSREDGKLVFERAVVLDLTDKIKIESLKTTKEKLKINDSLEIDTESLILLNGKKQIAWKDLKKGDSILCIVPDEIYILANNYVTKEEEEDNNKKSNDTSIYYISSITMYSSNSDNARVGLSNGKKTKIYEYKSSISKLSVGDCVLVTFKNGAVTNIKKATEKDYENLDLNDDLVLNLKDKNHAKGMLGKYTISSDTEIYEVQKRYKDNSDSVFETCKVVATSEKILDNLSNATVNVIYSGNVAKTIFIENEYNSFSVFYARVREVTEKKGVISIRIAPIADAVKTYETTGLVNCEPGDMITYTLSGSKDVKLHIEEVYRAGVIGYEKDLVVEKVNNNLVYLKDGDKFDRKDSFIEVNNKVYNVNEYVVINARVSRVDGSWKFVSAEFNDFAKASFEANDRIAIDELENTIVIYRGYEE